MRTKLILIKIIFLSPICFSHLFYPLQSADCLEWLHYFNKVQVGLAATATSSLVSSSAPAFEPFLYCYWVLLTCTLILCTVSFQVQAAVKWTRTQARDGTLVASWPPTCISMPYLLCCIHNPVTALKLMSLWIWCWQDFKTMVKSARLQRSCFAYLHLCCSLNLIR